MPDSNSRYSIGGEVGFGAVVQQGEYLTNITIQPKTVEDVKEILDFLEKKRAKLVKPGLPRQLKPEVFINRYTELNRIHDFFDNKDAKLLYVSGIAGVGKSVLIRSVLENPNPEIPLIWINCKGADVDSLLLQMNNGFKLEKQDLLRSNDSIESKIEAVLGAAKNKSIIVLDDFEALLNDEECFESKGIASLVKALTSLEHKIKVVAATPRLPSNTNEASTCINVLRLKGLSKKHAKDCFTASAKILGISSDKISLAIKSTAFGKINGHPYFLELFALALRDLPIDELEDELLQATDIDKYIIEHILKGLNDEELGILQASTIFLSDFKFGVLKYVYEEVNEERRLRSTTLRALIRASLLERLLETDSYYMHPILREAIPFEPELQAFAHSLAAKWFLREQINPEKYESWDDGLYHLRHAAEIGRNKSYYTQYREFLFEYSNSLAKAGWYRRLVQEFDILYTLSKDLPEGWQRIQDTFIILHKIGGFYYDLNDIMKAVELGRELIGLFPIEPTTTIKEENKPTYLYFAIISRINLGKTMVEMGETYPNMINEALELYNITKPIVDTSENRSLLLQHKELRFEIARKTNDPEMIDWGMELFKLIKQEYDESPSTKNLASLAVAHKSLALCYLKRGGPEDLNYMVHNFIEQLRIVIEIGQISGILWSLFNNGVCLSAFQDNDLKIMGGAMLFTSEQIALEIGFIFEAWQQQHVKEYGKTVLLNPTNIKAGREFLNGISEKLIPYYDRAIDRLAKAN